MVDFGRRPYRTRTKFFTGSDVLVDQWWYIADHDAVALPFATAFMNRDWDDNEAERDYYSHGNLGEQASAPKVTDFKPGPQGAVGLHQCGDVEWWTQGVPWSSTRPPTVYAADGLPVCCNPGRGIAWGKGLPTPRGGIMWGGAAPPPAPPNYKAGVGDPFERTLTYAAPDLWTFSDGFSYYTLEGPSNFFHPGEWELRIAISVFLNGTWRTSSWDGWGSRLFTFVSGIGFGADTHVESVPFHPP